MFVYYPKLAPLPRKETRFALNIDFAPTFAELAGAVGAEVAVDDGIHADKRGTPKQKEDRLEADHQPAGPQP